MGVVGTTVDVQQPPDTPATKQTSDALLYWPSHSEYASGGSCAAARWPHRSVCVALRCGATGRCDRLGGLCAQLRVVIVVCVCGGGAVCGHINDMCVRAAQGLRGIAGARRAGE